jgi:hypothetical protein
LSLLASWLGLSEITYQHYVVRFDPTRGNDLFSVTRPIEGKYLIRLEISQLLRLSPGKRLTPYVRDAGSRYDIG